MLKKDEIEKFRKAYRSAMEDYWQEAQKFWESLDPEKRLLALIYVSKILYDHAREGGTYRYLIYERFGFGFEAYAPLQHFGLLDVHNLISGELNRER